MKRGKYRTTISRMYFGVHVQQPQPLYMNIYAPTPHRPNPTIVSISVLSVFQVQPVTRKSTSRMRPSEILSIMKARKEWRRHPSPAI